MNTSEREQFLKDRLSGLGGSDAAAVVGLNPWKSPMQVWMEKTGLHTVEETEPMYWGTAMEPLLRDRLADVMRDRTGAVVTVGQVNDCLRLPGREFLLCHPDGILEAAGKKYLVELKTANDRMRVHYGEPWSDEVPEQYLVQCQHNLGVLSNGIKTCFLGVLFGNREFQVFEIQKHETLIDRLFEMETTFWQNYVLPQIAPPADGSESTAEMLKRLYPKDTGIEVASTDEIDQVARQLAFVREKIKNLEEQEALSINQIKEFMKDAAVLTGNGYRVTYKQDKESTKTDWKALAMTYNPDAGLILQFSQTKEGARRFLPKFPEGFGDEGKTNG